MDILSQVLAVLGILVTISVPLLGLYIKKKNSNTSNLERIKNNFTIYYRSLSGILKQKPEIYQSNDLETTEKFIYSTRSTQFVGRAEELKELNSFLDYDDKNNKPLWWAVTGDGGSGKSRLVYEFIKKIPKGWVCAITLKNSSFDKNELQLLYDRYKNKNILIILDYVNSDIAGIRDWIYELGDMRKKDPKTLLNSKKVRILFMQREGAKIHKVDEKNKKIYDNESQWYHILCGLEIPNSIKEYQYPINLTDFSLNLPPLSKEDIKSIVQSFSEYNYKKSKGNVKKLNSEDISHVIDALEQIDGTLLRPLYAMFITDALCNGETLTSTNEKEVLDYILKRELKFINIKMRQVFLDIKDVETSVFGGEVYLLYAKATIVGHCALNEENLSVLTKNSHLDFTALISDFNKVGISHGGIIYTIEPDLIGEYYIYHSIGRMGINRFIEEFSSFLKSNISFLTRFFNDYVLLIIETYGMGNLRKLLDDEEIRGRFAYGLRFNARSENDAVNINKILSELRKDYSEDKTILENYAVVLGILTYYLDEPGTRATLNDLATLHTQYPQNQDIALIYAKALFNLTVEQDEPGTRATLNDLAVLHTQYPDNQEIALEYALGLFNLTVEQDEPGTRATLNDLAALHTQYPDNQEIALEYAKGLFNMTVEQDEPERRATLETLSALRTAFPDNQEIALAYAKGLVNLIATQDESGTRATLKTLSALRTAFPDNQEIALRYAKGLFNLIATQDGPERRATLKTLSALRTAFPDNQEIALEYAKGLFILTVEQDEPGTRATLNDLAALHTHNIPTTRRLP